jgi:TRAP-type mannitol/chloroaromatic compound transport system permease small subunit
MQKLIKATKKIEKFSDRTALVATYLCIVMVALTAEQVIARYLFNSSSAAMQELVWHLFGAVFLLGAAQTFKKNGHVRVDIFYNRFSDKKKVLIELGGTLLFLAPMCLVLIYTGVDFTLRALSYDTPNVDHLSAPLRFLFTTIFAGEASPDPGGLPGRWIIKALIPISMIFLLLQGVAHFIKNLIRLRMLG